MSDNNVEKVDHIRNDNKQKKSELTDQIDFFINEMTQQVPECQMNYGKNLHTRQKMTQNYKSLRKI